MKARGLLPIAALCSLCTIIDSVYAQNTAYGTGALISNTTGSYNSAFGYDVMRLNTTGSWGSAFGYNALYSNTSGTANTAGGYTALWGNTSGYNNTAIGYAAMQSNTNGFSNTAVGTAALSANTSGAGNIALGYRSGNAITTGYDNICIGNFGTSADSQIIRIGTQDVQTNTFVAGIYGTTAASGVAVYVNSSGKLGTLTSSERYKKDIKGMGDASEVIHALHPVTFRYKSELDKDGISQFGLVAEEVAKIAPELVVRDDKNQTYTVRYQAINAMLLNEFLKQHQTVEEQKREIAALKENVSKMELLEQRLNSLTQRLQSLAEEK